MRVLTNARINGLNADQDTFEPQHTRTGTNCIDIITDSRFSVRLFLSLSPFYPRLMPSFALWSLIVSSNSSRLI
jgi:hypothetical protein